MLVSLYDITVVPDSETEEFKVVLHGPGIDSEGRRYIFANTYRCTAFAEAVNFAYQQGVRDARREARQATAEDGRMLVVSGTTPDNMTLCREGWWQQLRRRMR